jgi:protein-S-isoprenylcysteine O-methyltransferase Ste14
MRLHDLPAFALGVTISAYWLCVGVKAFKVSRGGRRLGRVLVPRLRNERFMWIVWVPLVAAWIAMPYVAPAQAHDRHPWIGMPNLDDAPIVMRVLRSLAAAAALGCLILSIKCWRYMGRNWRMGIDPSQRSELLSGGPFAAVRHPIYALSMALMICSVLIVPTRVMMILAVLHIALLVLKARNEERFLFNVHGNAYTRYCERTPRFFPWPDFLRGSGGRSARGDQPL